MTERGIPVARVLAVDEAPVIERLTIEGIVSAPQSSKRPQARGRSRVRAAGPVADIVSEQRD